MRRLWVSWIFSCVLSLTGCKPQADAETFYAVMRKHHLFPLVFELSRPMTFRVPAGASFVVRVSTSLSSYEGRWVYMSEADPFLEEVGVTYPESPHCQTLHRSYCFPEAHEALGVAEFKYRARHQGFGTLQFLYNDHRRVEAAFELPLASREAAIVVYDQEAPYTAGEVIRRWKRVDFVPRYEASIEWQKGE